MSNYPCCPCYIIIIHAPLVGSVLHHYETELNRLRSEYAGLSGTKRKELENLLMEGDLLEVTVDEVHQLWTVLHQDAETLAAFERSGAEGGEGDQGKGEEGRRRRKRKGVSLSGAGVSSSSSEVPMVSSVRGAKLPASKRQKRMTRSTTPKSSPSPVPSNSSSHSELNRRTLQGLCLANLWVCLVTGRVVGNTMESA